MVIEILNGRENLSNCKFKLHKNLNFNLCRKIPRNSNPIKVWKHGCTFPSTSLASAEKGLQGFPLLRDLNVIRSAFVWVLLRPPEE